MEQYIRMYDSYTPRSAYVPTGRIQVMNSVYLPASEINFANGQLQPDRLRRRRTQGMRLEKERLDREDVKLKEALAKEASKGGVRVSLRAMVMIVSVVLFFCGFYILTQQGIIMKCQQSINRQERDIAKVQKENEELQAQVAEACSEANICYAASKELNMIRSEEVDAIHMSAISTRPLDEPQQNAAVTNGDAQPFVAAKSGGDRTASAAQ